VFPVFLCCRSELLDDAYEHLEDHYEHYQWKQRVDQVLDIKWSGHFPSAPELLYYGGQHLEYQHEHYQRKQRVQKL
jgi:hypothetical protein